MKSTVGPSRLGLLAGLCLLASVSYGHAQTDPASLYSTKCTSCHTFGRGDRVGPDLKGATDRHSRAWLLAWVRSSEKVIRSGDPAAVALFQKYRSQRMPDHDLTEVQIGALLDYLAAGGPEADARKQVREANSATSEEVLMGRHLFFGEVALEGGGLACASCHSLSKQRAVGGSLAPDLTQAYTRFWDKALNQRLVRACMPSAAPPRDQRRVTDKESLALRALLRTVNLDELKSAALGLQGTLPPAVPGR
jgi:mono/diheme cytochrome c family protein